MLHVCWMDIYIQYEAGSISQPLGARVCQGWWFGPTKRKQGRRMGVQGVHFRLCEGSFVRQHFLNTMLALCSHAVLECGAAFLVMLHSQFSVNVHYCLLILMSTQHCGLVGTHTHTCQLGWCSLTYSTVTKPKGLKFHTTLASRGHAGSKKSERSPFPFTAFTSLFQEPEPGKKPLDGEMCNSMSCTRSVIASCDDEAGNECQLGNHRCTCVGGTLRNREAQTPALPIPAETPEHPLQRD